MKRIAAIYLSLMLSIFCSIGAATPAYAADSNAPRANPAVGTPVAAAFETAGYVSHAKMLSSMTTGFKKLGALLYICCILSAIMTVAFAGRYDMALWLLVGPPMFFFLIRPGSSAGGSEWEFAGRKDALRERDRLLKGADINPADANNASWFFHNFNLISSDIAQQLIKLFTQSQARADQYFTVRQNITRDLFAHDIDDADLMTNIAAVRALCVEPLHAAQLMAMGARNAAYRNAKPEDGGPNNAYSYYKNVYCERFAKEKDQKKAIPDGPAKDYLINLLKGTGNTVESLNSQTCKQLWTYLLIGTHKRAKSAVGVSIVNRIPPAAPADVQEKIIGDIVKKITAQNWDRDGADPIDTECPAGTGSVLGNGNSNREKLERIFTAWTIRKIFTEDYRGPMLASLRGDANTSQDQAGYFNFQGKQAAYEMTRRATIQQKAAAMPYEIYFLMNALPYVQGIGLYALAVLFPFFAILVIMPGMAGSFFMWCALWVWLKSWDVGWALVMVADDVIWDLMPHNTFFRNTGSPNDFDPPNILEASFGGDYAYNLMMYYTLVGLMIGAVPIISANAILGAKRAVAGIMMDGLKTMASSLSSHVEDHVKTLQLGDVDRAKVEFMAMNAGKKVMALNNAMKANADRYGAGSIAQATYMDGLQMASVPAAYLNTVRSYVNWAKSGGEEMPVALKDEIDKMTRDAKFQEAVKAGMPKNRFKALMDHYKSKNPGMTDGQAFNEAEKHMFEMLDLHDPSIQTMKNLDGAMSNLQKLRDTGAISAEQFSAIEAGVGKGSEQSWKFNRAIEALDKLVEDKKLGADDRDVIKMVKGDENMGTALKTLSKYFAERDARGEGKYDRDKHGLVIDPTSAKDNKIVMPDANLQKHSDVIEHTRATRQLLEGYMEYRILGSLEARQPGALGWAVGSAVLGDLSAMTSVRNLSQSLVYQDLVVAYRRTENFQSQNLISLATHFYNFDAAKTDQWRFSEMVRAGISNREEWWNVPEAPVSVGPAADIAANIARIHLQGYGIRAQGNLIRANLDAIPK